MKKRWTTALVAVLCVALSACLCACSSSDSEASSAAGEVTSADVVGDWEVVAIEDGSEILTGDTLAMIGQGTTFGFDDDGSCFADTAGNVVNGTWKVSGDKITMDFDGQELTGTVKAGNIEVDGGMTLEPLEQGYQG